MSHSPAAVARRHERYGRWAVVTGASSGIGREMARRLAADGLHLVLVARRADVLTELARELADRYGIDARVLAADLGADGAAERVEAATRTLDVGLLVAAAGFGTSGPFVESTLADEAEMLRVNCQAAMELTHRFGQRFAARGRGGIVLLSSIVAFQGTPYAAHYAATKAYVQALAEALRVELAPRGVDVLACAPGPTHTGFAARAGMRMGRALAPADVARETLEALGRRSTVLPAILSKVLSWSLAPLPRAARVGIMGRVMHGMAAHA
jgi:short-subunit dehydrogenase